MTATHMWLASRATAQLPLIALDCAGLVFEVGITQTEEA